MRAPPVLNPASALWAKDWGLSALLVVQVLFVFVLPPLVHVGILGDTAVSVAFTLLLVAGVAAVSKSRMARALTATVAAATGVVHWAYYAGGMKGLATLNAVLSLVVMGLLAGVVLLQVFREGPMTLHRVQGAVAVYLLVGLMWAAVYELIALHWPGAFQLPDAASWSPSNLEYFSFSTLTTVGYGDVTAVHPIARSAAMLEALVGQLFPAILIARLVSMELQTRTKP
jgi:hypothetical protein